MKTIKYLLSAAMLTFVATASAQFANSGSSGGGFSLGNAQTEDYSRFKVSFATSSFSFDTNYYSDEPESLKGVSVEYLYGKHITQNLPLFIEYGGNLTWGISKEEFDDKDGSYTENLESTLNVMSLTIPINIAYKFSVNDDFSIEPHVGVGARFNVLANYSYSYDLYYKGEFEEDYEKSYSFFDKDYMGKDGQWNRFQMVGQAGIGFSFQKFYIGYEYSWNFMELAKKVKLNTNYISVGYNF